MSTNKSHTMACNNRKYSENVALDNNTNINPSTYTSMKPIDSSARQLSNAPNQSNSGIKSVKYQKDIDTEREKAFLSHQPNLWGKEKEGASGIKTTNQPICSNTQETDFGARQQSPYNPDQYINKEISHANREHSSTERNQMNISWTLVIFVEVVLSIAAIAVVIICFTNIKILTESSKQQQLAMQNIAEDVKELSANVQTFQQQLAVTKQQNVALEYSCNTTQYQLLEVVRNQSDAFERVFGRYISVYQYMKTITAQNWTASRANCQSVGGDLAVTGVQDLEKRRILYKKLNIRNNIWIGASDMQNEGDWKWVDGSKVANGTIHWSDSQPNGSGNQNCAETWDNYKTNDDSCNNVQQALCEKTFIIYAN